MALKELVKSINSELRAEKADAEGHRESPRLIRLYDTLIRLTNSEEDNAKIDMPVPTCKHEHIGPNGVCKDCGDQVFIQRA
jgi:hypothetical protein